MPNYPFESMMPTPIQASIVDGRIRLRSQFEHKLGIESIPGARKAGKGADFWGLPLTYTSFVLLDNVFPDHVLTPEAQAAKDGLKALVDGCRQLAKGLDGDLHQQVRDMVGQQWLHDYQVDGAVFLGSVKAGALLDEPGVGKTAQVALALRLYEDTLPALVICPKSVLYNWGKELDKFGIKSTVLHGEASKRRKVVDEYDPAETPVLITTYDMVKQYSRTAPYGTIKLARCHECDPRSLDAVTPEKCDVHERELNMIKWRTVVVDEAHRIAKPKTPQTRSVWGVARGAEYRWALTATPMEQSMVEFWALLHFLDPEEWSTSTKYRDRWAMQHTNFFGITEVLGVRPDRIEELQEVTGWRWIRRMMDTSRMPPRIIEYRTCELSAKEAKPYKQMAKQMMAEVEGGVITADNHMVKEGKLVQMASCSWRLDEDGQMVACEPSSKLDLLMDTLPDFDGQPVIIWFKHRGVMALAMDRIAATGKSFVVINGDISAKARQEAVDAFQAGQVDYILLTAGAGSEGVTLTRSRVSIVVERDWSSIKNTQLAGRHWRIGSEIHDDVMTVNLVTRGTVEEDLYESLQEKAEKVQEILRDDENRSV